MLTVCKLKETADGFRLDYGFTGVKDQIKASRYFENPEKAYLFFAGLCRDYIVHQLDLIRGSHRHSGFDHSDLLGCELNTFLSRLSNLKIPVWASGPLCNCRLAISTTAAKLAATLQKIEHDRKQLPNHGQVA